MNDHFYKYKVNVYSCGNIESSFIFLAETSLVYGDIISVNKEFYKVLHVSKTSVDALSLDKISVNGYKVIE